VEANIGIWDKRDKKLSEQNNMIHQALSQQAIAQGAELVVWPESRYQAARSFGTTSKSEDLLRLEMESLFKPSTRDGMRLALRALEAGFGTAFHRDRRFMFWRAIMFDVARPGLNMGYYTAPPDDITFYMPGYEAL